MTFSEIERADKKQAGEDAAPTLHCAMAAVCWQTASYPKPTPDYGACGRQCAPVLWGTLKNWLIAGVEDAVDTKSCGQHAQRRHNEHHHAHQREALKVERGRADQAVQLEIDERAAAQQLGD